MRKMLVIALSGVISLSAQGISNFSAVQNETGVLVSWVTDSGYICNNLKLLHSTDSINFSEIYFIPGICGSFSESQNYSFVHTTHSTGRNIYKLSYENTGSNCFFTNIIVPDLNNLQFYPNPVSYVATLINPISDGNPVQFSLISLSGRIVKQFTTSDASIYIDFSDVKGGVYIFELSNKSHVFRNKVLVSH